MQKLKWLVLLLVTCGLQVAHGQQSEKRSIALQAWLDQASDEPWIDLFLRGHRQQLATAVIQLGGWVKLAGREVLSVRMPAGQVNALATHPALLFIEFELPNGQPLNDQSLINNHVLPLHNGAPPLNHALNGDGVVMGIIDSGVELLHPDFLHEDGLTRVQFLWDQTQSGDPNRIPEPYGYGQEWTKEDIDAGICTHQDQAQYFGHGSTVTGTAAGNGLAIEAFKGVAPAADLVIVSSKLSLPNWTNSVADAVDYIFEKAAILNKPCVINASLGTYYGSHDGLDAAALLIAEKLQASPGRVMVSATGNGGALAPYHLRYDVGSDTAFTWFTYNANSSLGYGAVFFELWADTADFNNVQYAIGADKFTPFFEQQGYTPFRYITNNVNQLLTDTIFFNNQVMGIVRTWAGIRGGQYQLQAEVTQPFSNQYRFRFATTGSGTFDIWTTSTFGTSDMIVNLPSVAAFPDMVNYRLPDNQKTIVSSWNCSDEVISVGNYTNRNQYVNYLGDVTTNSDTPGQIAASSSRGPTRDGRVKPDISASGDLTLSSGKFSQLTWFINNEPFKVAQGGLHYRNGGTSMASPVVAGTAALYLERCPLATHTDIRQAVIDHAFIDTFTRGSMPGLQWGWGKLDAYAAVISSVQPIDISASEDTEFCIGDSLLLSAPTGMASYLWSTGDTTSSIFVFQTGTYSLEATDISGCMQASAPLDVLGFDPPAVPVIAQFGDTLFASQAFSYQWYFNGEAMEGATQPYLTVIQGGLYQVEIFNTAGCSNISEGYNTETSSVGDMQGLQSLSAYPNPVKALLNLEAKGTWLPGPVVVTLIDGSGRAVLREVWHGAAGGSQTQLSVAHLSRGMYLVEVLHPIHRLTTRVILE